MTSQYVPAQVTIRRYPDSPIYDVVVVVRDREMVLRFRDYRRAVQWARLECKSYKIPEPDIDFPANEESRDVPLFCIQIEIDRSPRCARCLKIENPRNVAARLDAMEKTPSRLWTPFGGPQETTIISEPGLYKLIQTRRKPAAKRFDRWVRNTNLPLIDPTVFTPLPLRRPNQNRNFLFGRLSQ